MNFLPWYNKKLIDFLQTFLTKGMIVFEYGAGNSTLFYAEKVKFVYSIETKKEWFDFVLKNKNSENIDIKLCLNLNNFVNEIEAFPEKKFDIIVVDSRDREKCIMKSIDFLAKDGILILDNSERKNLESARNYLVKIGFIEKVYTDLRLDGKTSTSSVFFQSQTF